MFIHNDSLIISKKINKYFTLKPSLIGETDIYLGTKVSKMTMPNSFWCWSMSPSKYIQEAVRNFEDTSERAMWRHVLSCEECG